MKNKVERSAYLIIDGEAKSVAATEKLLTDQGQVYLAMIFQNESYLIVDQTGKPVEYCPTEDTYADAIGHSTIFTAMAEKTSCFSEENDLLEKALEWNRTKKGKAYLLDCWVGLPAKRFASYKKWRTPSGYLCGTYAAAVLLAYYQDFRDELSLPEEIRKKGSPIDEPLSSELKKMIQPLGLPTIPLQVSGGLSRFLKKTDNPFSARNTIIGSWQRATKRIRQGKPVMVGILKILGSPYGNHWVTAYAYYESVSGERFYKVHDNWGDYQRIIPASWGNGTVSLP
ncbi:dihydrolipoamide dehydrogenase [Enterococcus durans]|uniref:Dihydrolipoamide dehydrogenase n=1 Tax=Enterococcus durans TaxID=53345 RepID=A0A367CIZ4_9ENTE|nr:dihydrolipoamide dehydrogenase [Enterococcus durans]RCA12332.1 hypothetical protein EA71_00539 [Enterococcus durans]